MSLKPREAILMKTSLSEADLQKVVILKEKCPLCGQEVACGNGYSMSLDSTHYYESAHACLNPECEFGKYVQQEEGDLGGGHVEHNSCYFCGREF